MSFLAFGAGFVNALNNRKREERAEEATIRKENRAFETAKKKYAFQNLYNQQISLNKQLNDFRIKVMNGQIKGPDGETPLTLESPSVIKAIKYLETKIDNVNRMINGETPSDIVTAEQGTDTDKRPKSLSPKTEEDIIYESREQGVSIPKQSFDIGMGTTVKEHEAREFRKQAATLPGGKLAIGIGDYFKGAFETLTDKEELEKSGLVPTNTDAIPRLRIRN